MSQFSNDPLAQVFAEYFQQAQTEQRGGDPAQSAPAAPPNTNLTIPVRGQPLVFSTPEQVGQVVDKTIEDYERKLAQVVAERDQLLGSMNKSPTREPAQTVKPTVDPEEHARLLLTDPAKAYDLAAENSPKFKAMQEQLAQLNTQTVVQQFVQKHPVYANADALGRIDQVRQQAGLGIQPDHLEAALALAQQRGAIPLEGILIQQAQAAQARQFQQFTAEPSAPQVGGWQNAQGTYQNQPTTQYAPPPSPGRMTNMPPSMPGQGDLDNLAYSLPLDKLNQMIQDLKTRTGQR